MKLNFSLLLLLIFIPCTFFLLKPENTKTNKVKFLHVENSSMERDTIKLFNIIGGEKIKYIGKFNQSVINEAFFYNDTIDIRLHVGGLGGYNLSIQIIGEKFTSKLIEYDCTGHKNLKVKRQMLQLENFELADKAKLKGEIYCEAQYNSKMNAGTLVKIEGYFEMDLVNVRN